MEGILSPAMVGEIFGVDGEYLLEGVRLSIEAREWGRRVRGLGRDFHFMPLLTARPNRPSASVLSPLIASVVSSGGAPRPGNQTTPPNSQLATESTNTTMNGVIEALHIFDDHK